MILDVRNLTKRYGEIQAVRDVSFALGAGEIFGLLGLNGAGKTTTLECILGLRRADAGAILIAGIESTSRPTEARKRVGAVLQAASLQDKITPRQALKLFAGFYPSASGPDELLNRFGLSAKANAPFDSLSGGQKQRLFLALAFIHAPPLLILDEPSAGLDPASRRELHQHMVALKSSGRTLLLSTHDLNEAEQLCDRVGVIHEGRLVACGAPRELMARVQAAHRLVVGTTRMISRAEIDSLPGLVKSAERNGEWVFETSDVNRTLSALTALLTGTQNAFSNLRIERPTLEDAFAELTGRPWSEPEPTDPQTLGG